MGGVETQGYPIQKGDRGQAWHACSLDMGHPERRTAKGEGTKVGGG